jgi:hypothetical protein
VTDCFLFCSKEAITDYTINCQTVRHPFTSRAGAARLLALDGCFREDSPIRHPHVGTCEKTCSVLMLADILYMNGRARRY